ncbi:U1 protein [Ekpoma virus 1]|uniref:U1 protein n=1 Tax=Ekpoma virus 1 TaxID=1987020 RepID=A0A0C5C381_9RHAB|nr:U1 protein [Ekpoma virus 1]AJN08913.1 U1 protein [Ekpoma virus 1]
MTAKLHIQLRLSILSDNIDGLSNHEILSDMLYLTTKYAKDPYMMALIGYAGMDMPEELRYSRRDMGNAILLESKTIKVVSLSSTLAHPLEEDFFFYCQSNQEKDILETHGSFIIDARVHITSDDMPTYPDSINPQHQGRRDYVIGYLRKSGVDIDINQDGILIKSWFEEVVGDMFD